MNKMQYISINKSCKNCENALNLDKGYYEDIYDPFWLFPFIWCSNHCILMRKNSYCTLYESTYENIDNIIIGKDMDFNILREKCGCGHNFYEGIHGIFCPKCDIEKE
jgi:hypothetical protein